MSYDDYLLRLAIDGDSEAKLALLARLQLLVHGKARRFVKLYYDSREHYDDLCQDGMAVVIDAVDRLIAKGEPPRAIRAYAAAAAQHAFIRYRAATPLISCSDRTISRARKAGQPVPAVQTTSVDFSRLLVDATVDFETEDRTRLKSDGRGGMQRRLAKDGCDQLLERIMDCCQTPQEEQIVKLRIEGCSDAEIASQLDVSARTVKRARDRIEARFDASQSTLAV